MIGIIIAFVAVTLTLYFFYYVSCLHRSNYWKNRGIPSPKGQEVLAGHLKFLINPQYPNVLQIRDWTKKLGRIYGFREGWRQVLVISDPDLVHELVVKKFEFFHGRKNNPMVGNVDKEPRAHVFSARGARWKRLRTISSPSFNVTNLKKIMPTVDDSVNVMMKHLKKEADAGNPFNIHPYFHELTMDVICRIAMGQKGSKQFDNPNVDVCKRVFAAFGVDKLSTLAHSIPWDWSIWLLRRFAILTATLRKAPFKELIDILYKEVNERKEMRANGQIAQDGQSIDFIDLFLDAEADEIPDQNGNYQHSGGKVSKKMTTDEIVAQCFVFLLAGFDTTANTLANTIFFLAKDPERQKILQAEIDEVCPDEDVAYEQLQSLKYGDAVMKEALRKVPIAAFAASRECNETTTLGQLVIEKGTQVQVDVFTLHHDKEIWGDDADDFVPERFLDNESRHPSVWIPFGGGPRTCIGMRLAYMEEKLALVRILKEYDIVECEQTEKELKLVGSAVLNPESVTIKLVKRI